MMEAYDGAPVQSNTLNRFNETSAKVQRYKILLRRRWWFLLLTAAIAVCVETLRISEKETEYVSIGKVVVGMKIDASSKDQGNVVQMTNLQDFYGTQIEILKSGELRRRALDRVRSLHPELKEIDVNIEVSQTRGSSILNVAAVGGEAKYTHIYLDEVLNEYIAFRKEMIEKSLGSTMNKVIEEVLGREKKVKETEQTLLNFQKNNDMVVFEGDRNQAAAYLSKLKNDLNLYDTEKKLMERMGLEDYLKQKDRQGSSTPTSPAENKEQTSSGGNENPRGSDPFGGLSRTELEYLKALSDLKILEAERLQLLRVYKPEHPNIREVDEKVQKQNSLIDIHKQQCSDEWQRRMDSIKVKVDAVNDEIKEWEVKARDANDRIVTHQALKNEYARTAEDYREWKKTLERIDATGVTTSDMVAIMERPQGAVEEERKLWLPLGIALIVGLAAGSIILLLFDRLDDRMNSFSEFQALFPNEAILGQIPEQNSRGDVSLIRPNDDRHLYAEAFRNLRSSMLFKNWKSGKPPKLILVTSAVPNEGKTTTVANMAVTMALGGSRVLLADGDLRRGGVNELFKLPATPGFSDVLYAKLHWRDAVQETGTKGLHILPRGEALDQTSELFLSPLSDEILKEMAEEYDYVIFDSAPVLVADDTASFAPKVEAVLFVIRMSSTMARLTSKALDLLYERQVNVAGVILNRSSTNLKEYTYYNYASYYSVARNKGKGVTPTV